MYTSNRTRCRLAGLVALGLILTALGAEGAQAASRPASSYYTPQALAALKLRGEAMNRLYGSAARVIPSAELRALQRGDEPPRQARRKCRLASGAACAADPWRGPQPHGAADQRRRTVGWL